MKKIKFFAVLYVLAIHALLVVVLLKSDFISKFEVKFGIGSAQPSALSGHAYYMDALGRYYAHRSETMRHGKGIVFIGDSITNGLCVESLFGAVNFGISGDTINNAKNIVNNYKNLEDKTIILELGINDIPRKAADIVNDFSLLINRLPTSAHIYISAILPIDEAAFYAHLKVVKTNSEIDELNKQLKSLSSTYKNVTFIDLSYLLKDQFGSLKNIYHSGDGIHPNEAGYEKWILGLRKACPELAEQDAAANP